MKTLQIGLGILLVSGFSAPVRAMGKSSCSPLTGAYVLQACDSDGADPLRLPSQERHQNGSIYDHIGKLPWGTELRITQRTCDQLALDYQSTLGPDHLAVETGRKRIAGPAEQISGSTTITRRVAREGSRGISVALDARYTYVPVIAVSHTRVNWKFERAGQGGLQITYEGTDKQRRICTFVPSP